jgi:maltooligosyltrehalose trehalohydrolase
MAGAVMVSPYLPMLFMGEEWSEQNPFLYFVSHTDKELIEAVRKGRKEEFAAFHVDGEAPDPQSETTFEQSKLNWESLDKGQHKTMLHYYKTLIALRKKLPALHSLNRKNLTVEFNEQQQTLQLHRWKGVQHVFCYMNFSKEQQPLALPAEHGNLKIVLDSSAPEYKDAVAKQEHLMSSAVIKPESIIIYTN